MVDIKIETGLKTRLMESVGGPIPFSTGKPLRVLILGAFSGHKTGDTPLAIRRHWRIDQDNFDDVFSKMAPLLKLPFEQEPLVFSTLDDLHPDYLYSHSLIFKEYRRLTRQLKSTEEFNQAASRLAQLGLIQTEVHNKPNIEKLNLDDLWNLAVEQGKVQSDIESLIRQTIAPYLVPKLNTKADEYIEAVNRAASETLRQLMRAPDFKKLEARWRSLDFLQRRLDLCESCQLSLLDVSVQELIIDAHSNFNTNTSSALLQNLDHCEPYDIILLDEAIQLNSANLTLIPWIMSCCQKVKAKLWMGLGWLPPAVIEEGILTPEWSSFKQHEHAANSVVAAPGFLLRRPYGKASNTTEYLAFEELNHFERREDYLWGNAAYLVLVCAGQQTTKGALLEDMVSHFYKDADGDMAVIPPTQAYLNQSQIEKLETLGLTVFQSVKNTQLVWLKTWVNLG